jgi:6-phospho-beta-glucosidase
MEAMVKKKVAAKTRSKGGSKAQKAGKAGLAAAPRAGTAPRGGRRAGPGKGLVLTVLGGGSFYTPSFVGTMCRCPQVFGDAEVRLHDLDPGRVALVKAFCERFVRAKAVPMTFVEVPDLDRSLDGADLAISTFRIGGLRSLMLDESIPPRFGYFGNETVGPGGIFMAVRTVPVMLDVASRMARLCPQAWLLNYANPTNFIGDALRRAGYPRTVSLCDGYMCPPNDIGHTLKLDPKRIVTRHAGINHCSWCYRAEMDGRDLLPELRAVDRRTVERNLSHLEPWAVERRLRWLEIMRLMGLYPAPAGHLEPYFYHDEWVARQRTRAADRRTHRADRARQNWDRLKAVLKSWDQAEADQVARTHFGGHADLAIGVAAALATDSGELFPVNVPHGGAVPGFTPETVLEVYSVVTRRGFAPQPVPRFPAGIEAQQNHLAAVQQIVVRGILEKDRRLILQGLCLHPFTRSMAVARELFETMWRAERDVLGPYWRGQG